MSAVRNKVIHRLVSSLSDFRLYERDAKNQQDREVMTELCRRQAELLDWAMVNVPERARKTRQIPAEDGGADVPADTF